MRFFYYFLFFCTHIKPATEYIYPVASLSNGRILYIHQHTPTDIKLLAWNPENNHTEPVLWSIFNPAAVQMLPNNSGFSFIDNGRLRIKLFEKRSPKAIDFDEPLFGINSLQWINEHSCCCSAQYNHNFALFELHDEGTLKVLAWQKGSDYLYPQKIDTQLFYIERCPTQNITHYRIMHCTYPDSQDAIMVVDFDTIPIIFLTMISDKQGFVLEHTKKIDNDDQITPFSYYQIKKQGDVWYKNLLFSFFLPTDLLISADRQLYESILPLLPRLIDNKIYFVTCNDNLELYSFSLVTQLVEKISLPAKKGHYFVPIQCGDKFYCGGTQTDDQKLFSFF
jgi:hypothetical protein